MLFKYIYLYIKQVVISSNNEHRFFYPVMYFIDLCNLVYEISWKMKRIAQVFVFATLELI